MKCSSYGCNKNASCSIGIFNKEYYCRECYEIVLNTKRIIGALPLIAPIVVGSMIMGFMRKLLQTGKRSRK